MYTSIRTVRVHICYVWCVLVRAYLIDLMKRFIVNVYQIHAPIQFEYTCDDDDVVASVAKSDTA